MAQGIPGSTDRDLLVDRLLHVGAACRLGSAAVQCVDLGEASRLFCGGQRISVVGLGDHHISVITC